MEQVVFYSTYSSDGSTPSPPYLSISIDAQMLSYYPGVTSMMNVDIALGGSTIREPISVSLVPIEDLYAIKRYIEEGDTKGYRKDLFLLFDLIPPWLALGDTLKNVSSEYMKIRLREAWILHHRDTLQSLVLMLPRHKVTGEYHDDISERNGVVIRHYRIKGAVHRDYQENRTRLLILSRAQELPWSIIKEHSLYYHNIFTQICPYLVAVPGMRSPYHSEYRREFHYYVIGNNQPTMVSTIKDMIKGSINDPGPFFTSMFITGDYVELVGSEPYHDPNMDTDTTTRYLSGILYHARPPRYTPPNKMTISFIIHKPIFPTLSHLLSAIPSDSKCIVIWDGDTYVSDRYLYSLDNRRDTFIHMPYENILDAARQARVSLEEGYTLYVPELDKQVVTTHKPTTVRDEGTLERGDLTFGELIPDDERLKYGDRSNYLRERRDVLEVGLKPDNEQIDYLAYALSRVDANSQAITHRHYAHTEPVAIILLD